MGWGRYGYLRRGRPRRAEELARFQLIESRGDRPPRSTKHSVRHKRQFSLLNRCGSPGVKQPAPAARAPGSPHDAPRITPQLSTPVRPVQMDPGRKMSLRRDRAGWFSAHHRSIARHDRPADWGSGHVPRPRLSPRRARSRPPRGTLTPLLTSAPWADARARRKASARATKAGTEEDSRMIEDSP